MEGIVMKCDPRSKAILKKYRTYFVQQTTMVIGTLQTTLIMHGIGSLKEKRGIVKSLIGRLKSRFNISISEVDHQDSKRSAILGIAVVGNDGSFIHEQLDTVLNFMQQDGRFYLGQVERELFNV